MNDNKHRGSPLDGFLEEQLAEAMQDRKLIKSALAVLMKTRRTQISRVLESSDGNVTIETLQREVALVGRRVQSELI